MAQVKAHEVAAYVKAPKAGHCVFLVYGPDRGLVSETAAQLAKNSGVALDDPFSTIRLDADDAASDPSRIADEVHTVSMFGGRRLVWITGSTQKHLIKAIDPVLDVPPEDSWVVIEAGDLKKTAPLRKRIESSKAAIALPCYQDREQALGQIIDEEAKASGLTIGRETRQHLMSMLGEDRMVSRNEVRKLCLYVGDAGEITTDHVADIVGDSSAMLMDNLVDDVALGNVEAAQQGFGKLMQRGQGTVPLLIALQRYFQQLHAMRVQMEATGRPSGSVIGSARPPLHYQRKAAVERALRSWALPGLETALSRLSTVAFEARANEKASSSLVATALLALSLQARRGR